MLTDIKQYMDSLVIHFLQRRGSLWKANSDIGVMNTVHSNSNINEILAVTGAGARLPEEYARASR